MFSGMIFSVRQIGAVGVVKLMAQPPGCRFSSRELRLVAAC